MTSSTLDIISHSSAQTQRLGARLGELLQGGELILLDGQLGTGKTTFTQGLAQGLGITEVVNSPTFTLLKEYPGRPRLGRTQGHIPTQSDGSQKTGTLSGGQVTALYHFDLYRLDNPDEILDLGFEDYFYSSGVCVVEWADRAGASPAPTPGETSVGAGLAPAQVWPSDHLRIRMKMLSETKQSLLFTATSERYSELLRQFQKNSYAATSS